MSSEAAAQAAAEEVNLFVRLADLEQRFVDLEQNRNELFAKAQAGDERIASLQEEKESFQATILKLKDDLSAANAQLQEEKSSKNEANALATLNQERASRVESEADNLREEISRLTETNKTLQNQVSSMEVHQKLAESSSVPLQYEIERFKKEVDVLSAHSKWLEEENARATQELSKTKTQHSQALMDLRQALDQAAMERDERQSELRRLARKKQELEGKVEKLSQEYRDSRLEAIAASEASEKEIQAERKLVDLQKGQVEQATRRYECLEKELMGLREVAAKASADTEKEFDVIRDEIQREANKVLEEQQIMFKKEIEALKKDLSARESMGSPLKSRRLLTMGDSDEPMGLSDLYARLNETEDELLKARTECEKHRSYVQRVVAEVAAKTPQMLRQRKEYEMAVERVDEMQSRLRDALQETKRYRDEATELREELSRLHRRNDELQGESKDLAKHVQALLASKAGADVPEGVPTSVAEVQEQNQQLLGEQRRLWAQVEELQRQLNNDRTVARLQKAEQELETLQEEQKRQETYIASIAKQRDLYRALLSSQDGTAVDLVNAELVVAQQSQDAQAAVERCKTLEHELADARAEVNGLKGDKDFMLQRIERLSVHSNELTVAVDRLQNELSTANANAARDKADSSYHRDKCARAEQNLEDCRQELNCHSQLRSETQDLNTRLHQQLSEALAHVSKLESDFRQAEMKLRLAKTQEETAKSAEARLLGEVLQLRSEVARQGSLSETVQRIEASLTAQNQEDKEKLKEEVDRLKQLLENERLRSGLELENLQSRIKELELAALEAERKKDQAMKESIAAKGEALAATTDRQKAIAQVARLESELSSARKKLGVTTVDLAEVSLQGQVESLTQRLEEAKTENAKIKERAGNFEEMAKESERQLMLLTRASDDFKMRRDNEVQELQARIDAIKDEGKKKDEMISELTRDLSSLRGEQETAEALLKEAIVGLESQVATASKDAEAASARTEALAAEVQKYRDDAVKAQSNYERELELHAAASKDLRAAREEIASEQRLRRSAETRFENAKVEMTEKEKQLQLEKEMITNRMKEIEESLELTRTQNDLLLSQLTSLGDQVEKTQFDRIDASAGDAVSSDEVETLRKEVSDLREIVKFMRSEREMNEAKIDAARRTAEREKAVGAVTMRSLDEARAEIKILQEQISCATAAPSESDAEVSLKKEEEQLALLQESNRLLRGEGKKLQESLEAALVQLDEQRQLVAPLEQKHNDLSVEKAALVAEKSSLQRELESWKQRVQSLVSKFNQIDPEEHSRILKQAESLEKEINDLKAQKEVTEKEGTNAKAIVSKLNKELAQQKALVQKQQSLLKKMQSDKESATVSSSATAVITKENAMLKEKLQKMDAESKSNQTELKGASDRIEMLKQRMRQFQKTIGEQRKKISDLESAAAAPVAVPEAKAQSSSLPSSASPQKAAMPVITAESTSASEIKEEQKVEPKESATKVEKEVPAVVEAAKESLPSTPAGGFKFGPSSTPAPAKKEEAQKRAAPTVVVPADKSSSSAPPSKRAKVVDKAQENVKDKAETEKVEALPKLGDANADDKAKADGKAKADENAKADEKAKADEEAKADEQAKAAQILKDQLLRKREALVQRKKKLEEATAKQHAQQSPTKEEQFPDTKATPLPIPEQATAAAVVLEASSEPEPESKEAERPAIESTAEVKATFKSLAHAAKAAVDEKTEASAPAAEKRETEAPKTLSFGTSPFGNPTFGSGTAPTFGSNSFGKPPSGGGLVFGTSPSILGFGSSATKDTSSTTSSVFLDMKPPSSTAAPFTFGSTSITLPTPSIAAPPSVASPFGAFGGSNPFGGGAATNSAALPLFGSATSFKRAAPEVSTGEEESAKQARVEVESEGENEGD